MFRTVLVPLDGSRLAERVVPYATRLAKASGARVVLFRAGAAELQGETAGRLQQELVAIGHDVERDGVGVETRVAFGEPHAAVLSAAREVQADLIAMSTHGRSGVGRVVYGSVADRVMRQADVPVLLVGPGSNHVWPEDRALRVMVPLDGSALAHEALGPAQEVARAMGAEILLMRAVESPAPRYTDAYPYSLHNLQAQLEQAREELEPVAEELRSRGLDARVHALTGSPASAIVDLARERGADLIVMATHGSGGVARLLMGSVATETVQRASVPVLVVRPRAVRGSGVRSE